MAVRATASAHPEGDASPAPRKRKSPPAQEPAQCTLPL
jgi:hypothetical protein